MPLGSGFLEVRDQVRSVLGLLEPGEHLSTQGPSKLSIIACRSHRKKSSTGGEWQKQTQGQTKQPQIPYEALACSRHTGDCSGGA